MFLAKMKVIFAKENQKGPHFDLNHWGKSEILSMIDEARRGAYWGY